jgi:hypothetical protein
MNIYVALKTYASSIINKNGPKTITWTNIKCHDHILSYPTQLLDISRGYLESIILEWMNKNVGIQRGLGVIVP